MQQRRAFGAPDYRRGGARMTVMHVITGLGTGGAERMLANLCIAQHRNGVSPTVISLSPGGSQRARLHAAGVPVEDLGLRRGIPNPLGLFRLAGIIRREKPAVIQSWMYHADLVALLSLWLSGQRSPTRLYWGVRCSDVDLGAYSLSLRIVVRLCALLSRFADGVVYNSQAGRIAHRKLGYRSRQSVVIDNGFDTGDFTPDRAGGDQVRRELGLPEDAFVIVTVARYDTMKGYDTLQAAMQRSSGAVCLVIGAGTEVLAGKPGMTPLGERDDVPRLLSAADVLVSPSHFGEGFSNAIGEAMASGLPVVATDVGDAARIVGDAGLIVPPRDPDALASAISRLQDDADLRRSLGEKARAQIERSFGLQHSIDAFEALHNAVAAPEKADP